MREMDNEHKESDEWQWIVTDWKRSVIHITRFITYHEIHAMVHYQILYLIMVMVVHRFQQQHYV